jgi:2-succinyl-5-enolpyruvyl-6-hydroxy-3-cyclohexene-1-carboxylate synthase
VQQQHRLGHADILTSSATDQYVLLRAFVDELARCGVRAACTSPGSRSTPIVVSLVSDSRLTCHSHVDERAAGFFALGLAKASGEAVAVTCTSGTAAAELLPAVVEAHEAGVPLLILTADRPPELREVGAGQAIDQVKLYGSAAKWFFEVGNHPATPDRVRWIRTLACRAYHAAVGGRPGAVHLNFPLREPLVLDGRLPEDQTGRAGGAPFVARRHAGGADAATAARELSALIAGAVRPVLIAGRHERPASLGSDAAALAGALGWPLLADPLSGARRGPAAIAHYDALLRDERFAAEHRPDLVLRVGDLPTSKPLRSWLASRADAPQVAIDASGRWQDPDAVVGHVLAAEPAAVLRALASSGSPGASSGAPAASSGSPGASSGAPGRADPDWLAGWLRADEQARGAIDGQLRDGGLSEPLVAAHLGHALPADATLFVASSMPVRDVETFFPVRDDPPRVLSNRGANGIDGTVSSAFGAAAAGAGPVVLLIGDVALAHDVGGLLAARRLDLELTIVLLDNGGGGIFDFLPVAGAGIARDAYTEHIATPTGLDFSRAADLYGLGHTRVTAADELAGALQRALDAPRTAIVEVPGDRERNVALHRGIWDAVAEAIRAAR